MYHNITQEYNFSYNLRTRPLRLPFTRHVYAESCLKFQLVKVLNDTDKSILQMIENQTHSYIYFSSNVTKSFINKYNPECGVVDCYNNNNNNNNNIFISYMLHVFVNSTL